MKKAMVLAAAAAMAVMTAISANAQVIVNPDGTHSTVHGRGRSRVIVNPDGTHSTVHGRGRVIVNSDGTHSVVTGGSLTDDDNRNGTRSAFDSDDDRSLFDSAAAVMAVTDAGAQERFAERPRTETTQSVSLSIPIGAGLHYAYEHPLARRATITGRVGLDAGAVWGYNMLGGDWGFWAVAPSIDIEPRFYYGLDRRASRGRGTAGNAGSFLALQMKNVMPFGYISDSDLTLVGATSFTPMWGMRRVWGDRWLFEFTAGVALAWGWQGGFQGSPLLGVRFGYSF